MSIDRAAIAETEMLIRPHIRRTPIVEIHPRDFGFEGRDFQLTLKLEQLQHAGSFKARGAFNNLLSRDIPKAGVVAASGGNHGAAVAYAAMRLGISARIFVPAISSPAKIARIRAYKADLVVGGERYADALAASEAWQNESGALAIHAYDAPETIRGAATVALELDAQAPQLETVLAGVGGGGLIAGIAAWYAGTASVIGVEPEGCATLHAALEAGRPVEVPVAGVAADSLGARSIGAEVFPIVTAHVAQALLVTDDAIRNAQRALWDAARLVVEPGAAAALASLLSGAYVPRAGERVGIVLSGANTTAVDFDR